MDPEEAIKELQQLQNIRKGVATAKKRCFDIGQALQEWMDKGGFQPGTPLLVTGHKLHKAVPRYKVLNMKYKQVVEIVELFGCYWNACYRSDNTYSLRPISRNY